jgi:hypothetical protein
MKIQRDLEDPTPLLYAEAQRVDHQLGVRLRTRQVTPTTKSRTL